MTRRASCCQVLKDEEETSSWLEAQLHQIKEMAIGATCRTRPGETNNYTAVCLDYYTRCLDRDVSCRGWRSRSGTLLVTVASSLSLDVSITSSPSTSLSCEVTTLMPASPLSAVTVAVTRLARLAALFADCVGQHIA